MIKKFESFNSLDEKINDLRLLNEIFSIIEDESVDSKYYLIDVHSRYNLDGSKDQFDEPLFNNGFRIYFSFIWKSAEDFQRITLLILQLIQRASTEDFRFIYKNGDVIKSSFIIRGAYLFFYDIMEEGVETILKKLGDMRMVQGQKYSSTLYFKKHSDI